MNRNMKNRSDKPQKGVIAVIVILCCIIALVATNLIIIEFILQNRNNAVPQRSSEGEILTTETADSKESIIIEIPIPKSETEAQTEQIPETTTLSPTEKITETPTDPPTEPITSVQTEKTTEVPTKPAIVASVTPTSVFSYATASSVLDPTFTQKKTYYYNADNVLNSDLSTSWTEGADGDGVGESITIYADSPQYVTQLEIYNGICENSSIFYKNNRVKDIIVTLSNGEEYGATLDGEYASQPTILNFPETVLVESITFTIASTYPGSTYDDTAISYIKVIGE